MAAIQPFCGLVLWLDRSVWRVMSWHEALRIGYGFISKLSRLNVI